MRILVQGSEAFQSLIRTLLPRPELVFGEDPLPPNLDLALIEWSEERPPLLRALHALGVPTGVCLSSAPSPTDQLYRDLGVSQVFAFPLKGEELERFIASRSPQAQNEALRRVWRRHRASFLRSLAEIESSNLEQARAHAHRLAGSLGSLGLPQGTQLARRLEHLLPQGRTPECEELCHTLRTLVEAQFTTGPVESDGLQEVRPGDPLVLVVDDDEVLCGLLEDEAHRHGLRTLSALSVREARPLLRTHFPDAVVLDLNFPDASDSSLQFLAEVNSVFRDIPVVVLTAACTAADRAAVARLGARAFLQKPLPIGEVVEEIQRLLRHSAPKTATILAVDDDTAMLSHLEATLESHCLRVVTLSDPRLFWSRLEEVRPDLVLLDIEMPHINGLEICQALRNDPLRHDLPVIVLTAHTDPATVRRVFVAGADDFVGKPVVGPELASRVRSRLERFRLLQMIMETDPLTGLSNRRKVSQTIEQFLSLAHRQKKPYAVALLDLDHFKSINDMEGHAVGDQVLRATGALLSRSFRGEDTVARWGGEEFLVGMFGTTRQDAVSRISTLLEQLKSEHLFDGQKRPVSFSAGVAQYPEDGADLESLTAAADRALYRAKDEGRAQVLAVVS